MVTEEWLKEFEEKYSALLSEIFDDKFQGLRLISYCTPVTVSIDWDGEEFFTCLLHEDVDTLSETDLLKFLVKHDLSKSLKVRLWCL